MSTKTKIDRVRAALRGPLLTGLLLIAGGGAPRGVAAQAEPGWRFGSDPLAELWFHGLALVGFDGIGRSSLYRDGYAWQVIRARRDAGVEASTLEKARGALSSAFLADPAFEVLHFVPLYFEGVPVTAALDALDPRTSGPAGGLNARAERSAVALRHALRQPSQRDALAAFVEALRSEGPSGAGPEAEAVTAEVSEVWRTQVEPGLRSFLEREGFSSGRVLLVPSLGSEGRFLDTGEGPLVVVGASAADAPEAIAVSVVRELCYPAVRRAVAPYEARLEDRHAASDVSDQAATRCGALLVAERTPSLVEAYRGRFGDVTSRAAFLSAAGFPPSVSSLERVLDDALRRELNLNEGSDRASARSSGR